ncbi:MAG TPA: ASKHA domain-containing protein, partial [Sphingopyxis sp.]|nr:ASKHA domain-containing protein [Sphingopyxis sp.]
RVMTARPGYVAYRNSLRALQMIPVEVECGAADRFQIHARHIREADPAPDGLIVDVGTNAEIVLGNRDWLMSASSPTGPAFEGAEISAGMRAAP